MMAPSEFRPEELGDRDLLSLVLRRCKGLGESRSAAVASCYELLRRSAKAESNRPLLDSPARVAQQVPAAVRASSKEHFVAFYLNARSQLLHFETVSIGTLSASLVHPREVFAPALSCTAAGLVVAHNLCDASHKLCYVERPLMLSNRSESLLDRRNIERSVDGRDVLAAHKQVCSVA
jgi:DNA repair protein RadC